MSRNRLFPSHQWSQAAPRASLANVGRIFAALVLLCALVGGSSESVRAAASVTFVAEEYGPSADSYDLTVGVEPVGGGTTYPEVGTHSYSKHTVVNITASPGTGYAFDHWDGDCTGTGTCSLTMNSAKAITAYFTPHLGDWVWDDLNANGIQDESEIGHAGVGVMLRGDGADDSFGTVDDSTQSTITDSSGYNSFANPPSDTYRLQFTTSAGYYWSPKDAAANTLDSYVDPASGITDPFAWTAGGAPKSTWDAGLHTVSAVNDAPDQPVLVQPAEHATDVTASPTLEVTVSDPDPGDAVSVSFYGRAAKDFTIVDIPDPQNYASLYPQIYTDHLQWIADNKTSENIVFATSTGDLVNGPFTGQEWNIADAAFDTLDAGKVAYSVGPGNHDLGIDLGQGETLYANYFGIPRLADKPWYGGAYDSNNYNSYSLFSASGMDFILINLQYDTTSDHLARLNWAKALLEANPNRRGILAQHNVLNLDDTWSDGRVYHLLRNIPNLFLILCGHMHFDDTDGAAYVAVSRGDDPTLHVVLANYQDFLGSGYLRLLQFSPADDMIYMTTYSPVSDSYLTTDPDQKNLVYDMPDAEQWTLIGTVENVASGENASIPWPGLAGNTPYEWYATVSDGEETVTGATWRFNTETTTANQPPVLATIGDKSILAPANLTFTATATDDGLPSGGLAYMLAGPVPAGASITADGIFTWTPAEVQSGIHSVNVRASDGALVDEETIQIDVLAPLAVSALNLSQSLDKATWSAVTGDLAGGYTAPLDGIPASWYYLDVAALTANRNLADGYYGFTLEQTALPAGWIAYWAAKGVVEGATGWQDVMWQIINGNSPIFYLHASNGSYTLVDGLGKALGQADDYLRVNGDYPLGVYSYTCTVSDTVGGSVAVTAQMAFIGPGVPAAPSISIALGGQDVSLVWPAVNKDVNDKFTVVDNYQVFWSQVTQEPYFAPDPDPDTGNLVEEPTDLDYLHAGAAGSLTNYFYVMRAVNIIGPSEGSKRVGKFSFQLQPGTAP